MYLFPLSFSYLSDIFSPPLLSFSLPSASPSLCWPLQQAVLLELQTRPEDFGYFVGSLLGTSGK